MERPQHRSTRTTRRRVGVTAALAGLAVAGGAGVAACGAGSSRTAARQDVAPAAAAPTTAPAPLSVLGTSPAAGTALASATEPVSITFSSPLAAGAATPAVSPATPGSWARQGATLTFTPAAGYAPYTPLQVVVPAGEAAADRGTLASSVTVTWTTPAPTTRRIQQLLAATGYLPLTFTPAAAAPASTTPTSATSTSTTPTSTAPPSTTPTSTTPTSTAPVATGAPVPVADQPGTFSWRWAGTPAGLQAAWSEGQANLVTQGAVMAFEADHGLAVDGVAGPSVWRALSVAVAAGQVDPRPYDYISVTTSRPETLTVWQAGQVVYTTLANTGVPAAATAPGTFPVFERFTSTTMRGTNPDGSKYVDPGIPWVAYFHGGDAIHGFVRPGYGYPQSDGCVELPPDHAQAVYPMDFYGTLVTVA